MAFAELLGRSCFSFLQGASHPHEMLEQSVELGHSSFALCDRNGLYGSARIHAANEEPGHQLIVGVEMTLHPHPSQPSDTTNGASESTIALLVETLKGYENLCRLLTEAHRYGEKGEARIHAARVAEQNDGLHAIIPLDDRCPIAESDLAVLSDAFAERIAIATWRHLVPSDLSRVRYAEQVATRLGIPIVVSARASYHDAKRKPLADIVHCIRHRTTLSQAGSTLSPNAEATLKDEAALRSLFPKHPEWIDRTVAIAARCKFSLTELDYQFPSNYGDASQTPDQNLRSAVALGIVDRYPEGAPPTVAQQIEKELRLIAELEVAPYFLSVKHIVDIARERKILCQGRGSAANSAVCYVLGITAVDPSRSSLLFERFMSTARKEPPDIDVDFEHERREEVIQKIYELYGRDRAAMVSEIICYRGKSALREVGKVFDLATDQLDRLSSIASTFGDSEITRDALKRRGLDPQDSRIQHVVRYAREIQGFPRHLGVHVGGFVLSSAPLNRVAPIEPASMPGRTVIPWDKDDLETLGFFKVDVLGLGMLTAIRKALSAIHDYSLSAKKKPPFDPIRALAEIPAEDSAVYDAVCKADTIGVFQIESRAQMAMLPLLRPRKFYDLVVEVGIVRPGPIQGKMVHPYLKRRTGKQAVTYPHESLRPILERTLGVPLFQEQVMQLAIVGAGYEPGEADQLRRDMAAWRKNGRLKRHRKKLLTGFTKKGIALEFAERLYQQIQGFGEYGFPESHAASFALLVYASAWIKVHHPAAFAMALINSQPMGFYTAGSIVRDAQKHDVIVLPVDVNASDYNCSLSFGAATNEPAPKEKPALRLGFRLIGGIRQQAIEAMVMARQEGPFESVEALSHRTNLLKHEIEVLAEAGAFASLADCRREAMWQAHSVQVDGLFDKKRIESKKPAGLPSLSKREQLTFDYATVGLSLHDHPMRHLRKQLRKKRVVVADTQSKWRNNQVVTVAGVVLTRQRPQTASGVVFVTLEDETGTVNLVLYSRVYQQYELVARHAGIMLARGRVNRRGSVVHVQAQHLERLDLPKSEPLKLRSRDFH